MPLITCPDCNNQLSDAAPTCPHCGRPAAVVAPAATAAVAVPTFETYAAPHRPVGFWLGVGILLFPILFSWFTLRKGHSALSRIVAFTWLVVSFVIVGAQDGEQAATATSTAAISAAPEPKEVAQQVDIRQLLRDYESNEVGADNKYQGRLIQVTGVIDDVKKDLMDSLYVTLGTGKQFEIPQVQAFFDDSMNAQLGRLRKGDKLTVVCRVSGLMMNVLVKECSIK